MVDHHRAPQLAWPQVDASLLRRFPDSRSSHVFPALDVPRGRAQQRRRISGIRRSPEHQQPAATLKEHVRIHRTAQTLRHPPTLPQPLELRTGT
jgi:hypothetical protein